MHTSHKLFPRTTIVLAIAVACTPNTALAQDGGGYLGVTSGGPISAGDRVATDDLRDIATSAQISSEGDALTANFSFDMNMPNRVTFSDDNGSSYRVTNGSLSVKASLPLNSNAKGALVDFKTFGNNGTLTIGFNSYSATFANPFGTLKELSYYARGCIVQAGGKWATTHAGFDKNNNPALAAYDAAQGSYSSIEQRLDVARKVTENEAEGGFGKAAFDACHIRGSEGILNDNQYERFSSVEQIVPLTPTWRRKPATGYSTVFWGGEASFGYNRFSIADRTTVSLKNVERVGFDINGRVGLLFGGRGTILLLTGGYTRTYTAKDLADVCGPPDINGKTTCVNGQDGLPERTQTGYATLSLRHVLRRNKHGQPILGIRPSATYIFQDKAWQFEVPLYFQKSEKGGLDAGVRVIYNTGKDKVGVGAFVGVPF